MTCDRDHDCDDRGCDDRDCCGDGFYVFVLKQCDRIQISQRLAVKVKAPPL